MLNRRTRLCFFALVAFSVVSVTHAAEVEFVRVWPGWRTAESFDRISEYFSGHEATGRETVLRTHPDVRAGFYFLVRLAKSNASLDGSKFSLQLITPASPEPKTYTFPIGAAAQARVFELGLTGPDWPDKKIHPVAWRLDLLAPDDHLLGTAKSFLWELP